MNVADIVESAITVGTPELITTWLGPPNVRPPLSVARNSGLTSPYSGLGASCSCELHLAHDPLDEAQDQVRRAQSELVMALAFGEHHRVGQLHPPGLRRKGRLDHERPREVAPLAAIRAARSDLPVPRLGVEDPGEHRRAVIARQAQPGDRPVAVDQRRRVAVGQQAVVGDRPKRLVCGGHLRLRARVRRAHL